MRYAFDNRVPTIHPEAYVSPLAHVIGDVTVEKGCYVGHGAILRGDYGTIVVGEGTAVEEGVIVHAPPEHVCSIGKSVTLGHGAIVHGNRIGDFAVIGMGAILSIWSEVGSWAIVAEGAIVRLRQVIADGVVAAGNPAEVIRPVNDNDRLMWNYGKQLYVDLAKKYRAIGMQPINEDQEPGHGDR
uniref:Gamma carbonic anhydrase family protein n=2 Tax=Desulfatirhabdium butyrativorans TaxID=340467 RepID=A0A7C4RQC3_9BACT